MFNKYKIKSEKLVEISNKDFEDKMKSIELLQEKINKNKKIIEISNKDFEDKMKSIESQQKIDNIQQFS